jgi:hypothetical protein
MPRDANRRVEARFARHVDQHELDQHPRLAGLDPGQQERELVAAKAKRLAASSETTRDGLQRPVPRRVAVLVVDRLQPVHVEQADAERRVPAALRHLGGQPVVEAPAVAKTRDGVGEGRPHRLEGTQLGALVEVERDEWPEERDDEEGRAVPEDDEDDAQRDHDRQWHERRRHRAAEEADVLLVARARDDECDQGKVDGVEGRRGRRRLHEHV